MDNIVKWLMWKGTNKHWLMSENYVIIISCIILNVKLTCK